MLRFIAAIVLSTALSTAAIAAPSVEHTATLPSIAVPAPTLSKHDRLVVARLHAFIISKQRLNKKRIKEVESYAGRLARSIVVEARRNNLSAAAFAAIGWAESWYWWRTTGTSHEKGVWQVWPYGSAVGQEWDYLRRRNRIGIFPNKKWKSLGYKMQQRVLQDVVVSTALAARILRRLVLWCKARHRVHKHRLLGSRRHHRWIDRYAHYNSGTAWPKPVYYYQLRRYTRKIQAVLSGD